MFRSMLFALRLLARWQKPAMPWSPPWKVRKGMRFRSALYLPKRRKLTKRRTLTVSAEHRQMYGRKIGSYWKRSKRLTLQKYSKQAPQGASFFRCAGTFRQTPYCVLTVTVYPPACGECIVSRIPVLSDATGDNSIRRNSWTERWKEPAVPEQNA